MPIPLYAACHLHRHGGSIHLFRSRVRPPESSDVVASLALALERGDRLVIDAINEEDIANVPLVEPGSGAHLNLDTI